jgi:hypothetical protein
MVKMEPLGQQGELVVPEQLVVQVGLVEQVVLALREQPEQLVRQDRLAQPA